MVQEVVLRVAVFVRGVAVDATVLLHQGLRPAEARAHLGYVVVVAHEELVVVDVVDVVGVDDALLVGAGEREANVGGAHVGATRVEAAQFLLGLILGTASFAAASAVANNVAGALLVGAEEAGASCLIRARL